MTSPSNLHSIGATPAPVADANERNWKKLHDHIRKNAIKYDVTEVDTGTKSQAAWVATIAFEDFGVTFTSDDSFDSKAKAKENAASKVVKAWGL
ncbi:hypothetical protein FRB90_002127 [Tulasnella sp. 427]|nr:hypothetical protein FRB90_002127 [Tulasnella sp. 427]